MNKKNHHTFGKINKRVNLTNESLIESAITALNESGNKNPGLKVNCCIDKIKNGMCKRAVGRGRKVNK